MGSLTRSHMYRFSIAFAALGVLAIMAVVAFVGALTWDKNPKGVVHKAELKAALGPSVQDAARAVIADAAAQQNLSVLGTKVLALKNCNDKNCTVRVQLRYRTQTYLGVPGSNETAVLDVVMTHGVWAVKAVTPVS